MLKLILLGWVVGIAFMGIDIPLITQYGWIGKVLLFICLMFYIFKRHLVVNRPILKGVYYLICGLSLFVIGHQYAQHALNKRLQLREMQPESLDIVVYIDRISEEKDNKTQQLAQVLGRSSHAVNWLLYLKNENESELIEGPKLQLGHYYRISGKTRPAHSYAVSGAFDQEQWFIQRNIMSGFSVQHIEPLNSNEIYRLGYQSHLKQQQNFLTRQQLNIEKLRLKFRLMLKKSPFQNKGLLLALLTGDESLLNEDIKNQFKQLGISHLLAISGPHVLIFAILLSWGLHQLVRRYYPQLYLWQPKQILAMIPLCFGVLIYTSFVGFEIPALRTLLSVFLFAFLLLVKLPVKPFSLLVYSASLLLLFDPFSVLSAGFWLSYGSCFILLRIYQTIVQAPNLASLSLLSRIILLAKTLIESQGKIFIALCPLMLIFFQQISWVAPLTNIIAVPLLGGVIVPLNIFAACVWLIFNSLGNVLFQINDILLSMVLALIGLSCAIIILFLPRGVLPKFWSLICCLPLVIPNKTSQQIQLNIIDVGQGQAIFLQHPEQTWLIDTGGSYDEKAFSIGQNVVIPYLRQKGIKQLDHVVLSHLDQDHSGAFPFIAQALPIKQVISNQLWVEKVKEPFSYCHQGQKWQYPQLDIEILWPKEKDLNLVPFNQNEYSCVVYIHLKQVRGYQNYLIMGDAGWEAEYQLIKEYPDLKVDVLVLGHHGSKHSSAYDFLANLKPKLVIASAGFNNRYGHPSKEVLARIQELNIPFKSTVEQGTLSFVSENHQMILYTRRFKRTWLHRNL